MNKPKGLALLAAVMTAYVTLTSAASATVVTSPAGTPYTSTIKAESEGKPTLHGEGYAGTLACNSSVEGKVESHGSSVTAEGLLSALTWTACEGGSATTMKLGKLVAHAIGSSNATVTSTGTKVKTEMSTTFGPIICIYETVATDIGTLTGSTATHGKATFDISASIPRVEGSSLCGTRGIWTGSYIVSTPAFLNLDTNDPGATVTSNGSVYTGTVTAANDNGHVSLHGENGVTVECSSFIEGKVETHGPGLTAEGTVGALSFTGCTGSSGVHVKKKGTLIAHGLGSSNATITSTGAEIEATASSIFGTITCVYATNATDLGTLTGSSTTGGNATLDISAMIPRTAGSSLCGSSGAWTGGYTVTTPANLTVD
jgi:hypothetical protein